MRMGQVGWRTNIGFADPASTALLYRCMSSALIGLHDTFAFEAFVVTKVRFGRLLNIAPSP
jgi:hypothetical protein